MKKSRKAHYRYKTWGQYAQQSVAINARTGYIHGYTPSGKLAKIEFLPREVDSLIISLLTLKAGGA